MNIPQINQIKGEGNVAATGFYIPNGSMLLTSVRALLNLAGIASTTVFVKALYIDQNGEYQTAQSVPVTLTAALPSGQGVEQFIQMQLAQCWVQSVHVYCDRNITIHRGTIFAQVFVTPSATLLTSTPILESLCSGYVENAKALSYPESGNKTSIQDQGAPGELIVPTGLAVAETNPAMIALGATRRVFTFTVPSHARVTPQFLCFKVTPSAATPDYMLAVLDIPGNLVLLEITPSMVNVGTAYLSFSNSTNNPPTVLVFAAANIVTGKFPIFPMLVAGTKLIVSNNDAGATTVGDLAFSFEYWVDPQDATTPSNPGNALPNPPISPA